MTKKTQAAATSREDWLNRFIAAVRPVFEEAKFPLPEKVRASIGFPSTGRRSKRIGECWSSQASADAHFEVFLHPALQGETSRIADILTHELVHAACPGDGHGKLFRKCATALGLTGKMTATVAGPMWHKWADPIVKSLGAFPGANLEGGEFTGPKKQTTRMLKVDCSDCEVIMRASAKVAALIVGGECPNCGGELQLEG